MKPMKRAVHFDFHTMPGIDDFCKNFDAKEFAKQMEEANVDYVNIFARCNIGFSYYPTKVGTPYPTMKGNMAGDIIKELKARNIGVTAYLNGGQSHQYLVENPQNCKLAKNGNTFDRPGINMNFFRTPCYHRGFKEHLLEEIKEILEMDPDGIFVDCLIPRSCYCTKCVAKMKELGIDISDDDAVFRFAVDTTKDVMRSIREIVPSDKRLYLNSFPFDDIHQWVSHSELECLPTDPGGWGYDFFGTMAPYFRNFTNDRVYMTGAFVGSWGDFGGKKARAALENDVFDALLYGYAPSVGDHMHPRDGINKRLYKDVGEIFAYVKELEPWKDDAVPMCDVAILRNKITYKNVCNNVTDSDKGAARMLSELKICFDVINEDMDFDKYKLLVLPDNIEITQTLKKKLESYKGSILSTGNSCADGSVWDYITLCDNNDTDGFYEKDGEVYGQYVVGSKMKSDYSIADYVDPYFVRGFDGVHSYFYIPSKDCTGYSAIALKGNRAHICFKVFEAYITFGTAFHKELIKELIGKLLPEKLLEADELPSFTRCTLMEGKKGDLLQIKTTFPELKGEHGVIEDHILVKEGKTISVLGEYKKVSVLPEMSDVKSEIKDGRTYITLPELCGYKPFLLEK